MALQRAKDRAQHAREGLPDALEEGWSGKREDFENDPDVRGIVEWFATTCTLLPQIPGSPWSWGTAGAPWPICDLSIPTSRFVSQWVSGRFFGFDHVVPNYRWRASWSPIAAPGVPNTIESENWSTTWSSLAHLRHWLQSELNSKNSGGTLSACLQVLRWGGDRDPQVGATPFLNAQHAAGTLVAYLKLCVSQSQLASATLPLAGFKLTNSMMSKIYALAAIDGLPIYDSRVAAASASFVELYRLHTGQTWLKVPPSLAFPATDPALRRTVERLHPGAMSPGRFNYATPDLTARLWAEAAVRLGWLMKLALVQLGIGGAPLVDAMRWIEGGLFMMGYDVACLRPNLPPSTSITSSPVPAPSGSSTNRSKVGGVSKAKAKGKLKVGLTKTAQLLGPGAKTFAYAGTFQDGLLIDFGSGAILAVSTELLIALTDNFEGQTVYLGANRTNTPAGSIGDWLARHSQEFGLTLSSQHAARLTATLKQEGVVEVAPNPGIRAARIRGRQSIRVRFVGDN